MKVVCIKKFKSAGLQYELTYGKAYDTIPVIVFDSLGTDNYQILNDRNFVTFYSKKNFVSMEEYREIQLNQILNEVK